MKRLRGVWPQLRDFGNLYAAWRQARRGKAGHPDVQRFALGLERELLTLQAELDEGRYQPGDYRQFTIYERKPRIISAAPFRDRVVHHAVMNVIERTIDRRFIDDSYACRKERGVHRAVARYQQWAQAHTYALKLDIQRYFPSVDHALLKVKLACHIDDADVLALLARIMGQTWGRTRITL